MHSNIFEPRTFLEEGEPSGSQYNTILFSEKHQKLVLRILRPKLQYCWQCKMPVALDVCFQSIYLYIYFPFSTELDSTNQLVTIWFCIPMNVFNAQMFA